MKRIFTVTLLAGGLAVAGCGSAHLQHAPGKLSPSASASVPAWMTSVGPSASVPGFPGTSRTPSPAATRTVNVACHPRTPSGNCYLLNQQCPVRDRNVTGIAADGTPMICKTGTGTEPAGMYAWTALPDRSPGK